MSKQMCYKLNRSSMLYKRLMSRNLEDLGVTYAQLMVLRVIKNEPGITAKEILLQMDTDKATLSGIVSRLERDNYIYRVKNDGDGRVRNIYLSEGSEEICNKVEALEAVCLKDVAQGLTDEEVDTFVRILEKVLENQLRRIHEQKNLD